MRSMMRNTIPVDAELNPYVLDALLSRRWTQSTAAAYLGITPSQFGELLRGRVPRSLKDDWEFEQKFCEFAGLSPEEAFFKRGHEGELLFCEAELPDLLSVRDSSIDPLTFTESKEARALIVQALKTLEFWRPRHVLVIYLRFYEDKTLEEVGQTLGVTRERVRQMEAWAIRKLRHPSRARLLKDFLPGGPETCYNCGRLKSLCQYSCRLGKV